MNAFDIGTIFDFFRPQAQSNCVPFVPACLWYSLSLSLPTPSLRDRNEGRAIQALPKQSLRSSGAAPSSGIFQLALCQELFIIFCHHPGMLEDSQGQANHSVGFLLNPPIALMQKHEHSLKIHWKPTQLLSNHKGCVSMNDEPAE